MTLDIPTLSVAVMFVMGLSSFALLCNWLANRLIEGLLTVALGIICISIGACALFGSMSDANALAFMACETVGVAGHALVWIGIARYWEMQRRRLIIMLTFMVASFPLWQVYLLISGHELPVLMKASSFFSGVIASGVSFTLFRALGGHQGLYRGVVRRAKVGAALAFVMFFLHGLYMLLAAMPGGLLSPLIAATGQPQVILSHLEAMIFVLTFAVVMIIMTAERLQAELNIQELMDPLTKALNHGAFLEVVKAILARSRRNAEPVSLIMVDINKFKQINEDHGRTVGDAALSEFASLIMAGRRGQDVFCRFGGEEFVLMLPGTPEEGATIVASRIRSQIETTSLKPLGVPMQLSISMGVVTARGDDLDADGMISLVNKQMYHDQKLQFDRIETAAD